jgi:hypothetical protein
VRFIFPGPWLVTLSELAWSSDLQQLQHARGWKRCFWPHAAESYRLLEGCVFWPCFHRSLSDAIPSPLARFLGVRHALIKLLLICPEIGTYPCVHSTAVGRRCGSPVAGLDVPLSFSYCSGVRPATHGYGRKNRPSLLLSLM